MVSLIKQGRVQYGLETTPGTPAAATGRLAGAYTAEWKENLNIDQPSFIDGSIAAASEGDIMSEMGTLEVKSWLSYEDFVLCMVCGVGGVGSSTPTSDMDMDDPAGTWHAKPTLTGTMDAPNAGLKVATLQVGNLDVVEIGKYAIVQDFSFSWQAKQRAELTVHWLMRDLQPGSFTGAISKHRIERLAGSKFEFFMDDGQAVQPDDDEWTPFPGCLKSGVFNSGPLWVADDCCNGDLFYEKIVRSSELKPELRLTFEIDSNVAALRADWRAANTKLISLFQSGSIIHDTVTKDFRLNMAALITDMGPVGTANDVGIATEEVVFSGQEDSVANLLFEFIVTNALATAIP